MCLIICFLSNYRGKIRSVLYSPHTRKLLSSGEDGQVGVWDVDIQREETAEWGAGNTCEKCGIPFFWNVKEMWAKKTIGVRQVCRTFALSIHGPSLFYSLFISSSPPPLSLSLSPSPLSLSITAVSVVELCVLSALTRSPPILQWAMRFPFECALTATRRSLPTSECKTVSRLDGKAWFGWVGPVTAHILTSIY